MPSAAMDPQESSCSPPTDARRSNPAGCFHPPASPGPPSNSVLTRLPPTRAPNDSPPQTVARDHKTSSCLPITPAYLWASFDGAPCALTLRHAADSRSPADALLRALGWHAAAGALRAGRRVLPPHGTSITKALLGWARIRTSSARTPSPRCAPPWRFV